MKAEDEGEIVLAVMMEVESWVRIGGQLVGVGGDDEISLGWIAADQVALLLRLLAVEMQIGTFAPYPILSITMRFSSVHKRGEHREEEAKEEPKYMPLLLSASCPFETNTLYSIGEGRVHNGVVIPTGFAWGDNDMRKLVPELID